MEKLCTAAPIGVRLCTMVNCHVEEAMSEQFVVVIRMPRRYCDSYVIIMVCRFIVFYLLQYTNTQEG